MDSADYVILHGAPSPQVYHDLRKAALLTPPPPEAMAESVPRSLQNAFASLVVYERSRIIDATTPGPTQAPVGMGRLVGDGALFLIMCDIAVHPDHQRRGIGKRVSRMLVDHADEHAPHAYVSLVADPMGQKLYPKFGFEDVTPAVGMFRCVYAQQNKARRAEIVAKQVAAARMATT